MKQTNRWIVVIVIFAGLFLAACNRQAPQAAPAEGSPVTVEHLKEGLVVTRVTLTKDAAQRLDVQTAKMLDITVDGANRKTIPYAAVLYDVEGNTWTYLNPRPLVYERHPVKLDFINGNAAVLKEALPDGSAVVTTGATELYGSESEFEEE